MLEDGMKERFDGHNSHTFSILVTFVQHTYSHMV